MTEQETAIVSGGMLWNPRWPVRFHPTHKHPFLYYARVETLGMGV
jgi:hypothetical protein